MRQFILDFPKQFQKGIEVVKNAAGIELLKNKKFDSLIVCGMGGSALPAEILKMAPHFNLPVFIHRSYGLPRTTSQKSLIFISSYSGNTEEPLDAFNEAKKRNLKIVGFAAGGKLEEMCLKNNIPFVKYPREAENFQPRFALGYAFPAFFSVTHKLNLVSCVPEKKLSEVAESLNKKMNLFEKEGKSLSRKVYKKIPVIYGPENLKYLAHFWKINFNENSKAPAFWNYLPEMNHNEMTGWLNAAKIAKNKFIVLMFNDTETDGRILKRIKATTALLKKNGVEVVQLDFGKGLPLEKIFSSVVLSLWTSYYLAILYKTDPIPVKMVEDLKKMLKTK